MTTPSNDTEPEPELDDEAPPREEEESGRSARRGSPGGPHAAATRRPASDDLDDEQIAEQARTGAAAADERNELRAVAAVTPILAKNIRFIGTPFREYFTWDKEARYWRGGEGSIERARLLTEDPATNYVDTLSNDPQGKGKEKALATPHQWGVVKLLSNPGLDSLLDRASLRPPILAQSAQFDDARNAPRDNRFSLHTLSGTFDARDNAIRNAERSDMNTRIMRGRYDKAATCPNWDSSLLEWTGGDVSMVQFLQRCAGMLALPANIVNREDCFLIVYGPPRSGKGTWTETITGLLGDYAVKLDPSIMSKRAMEKEGLTPVYALRGKRLGCISGETDVGYTLNEALFKRLSGGEALTARTHNKGYETFDSTATILFTTNVLPNLQDVATTLNRIRVIPFPISFEGREDTQRVRKIAEETAGIISWICRGAHLYLQDVACNGRMTWHPKVLEATKAYGAEQDTIAQFIDERCTRDANATVKKRDLYSEYERFEQDGGRRPKSKITFGKAIANIATTSPRHGAAESWEGIGLRTTTHSAAERYADRYAPN